MKAFTIYDSSTGAVVRSGFCSEADFALQVAPGEAIAGFSADYRQHRIAIVSGVPTLASLPAKVLSPTETAAVLVDAVQRLLDSTAQKSGYDSIISACSYADEPAVAKFQAEGRAFRAWRSNVWVACYSAIDARAANLAPIDTASFVAALPKFIVT